MGPSTDVYISITSDQPDASTTTNSITISVPGPAEGVLPSNTEVERAIKRAAAGIIATLPNPRELPF